MKIRIKVSQEIEVKELLVKAGVRYWDDGTVNDTKDSDDAKMMPFRDNDVWCPVIDIDSGVIKDWPTGTTATVHYKVCDDGNYSIADSDGKIIATLDGYVPNIMCPKGEGYGDYIIMDIDRNGHIDEWNNDLDDFISDVEEAED